MYWKTLEIILNKRSKSITSLVFYVLTKKLEMLLLTRLAGNVNQKLLVEAKRKLGEILSAFEFLDIVAMDLVCLHGV